jgi:hypothetical protein
MGSSDDISTACIGGLILCAATSIHLFFRGKHTAILNLIEDLCQK